MTIFYIEVDDSIRSLPEGFESKIWMLIAKGMRIKKIERGDGEVKAVAAVASQVVFDPDPTYQPVERPEPLPRPAETLLDRLVEVRAEQLLGQLLDELRDKLKMATNAENNVIEHLKVKFPGRLCTKLADELMRLVDVPAPPIGQDYSSEALLPLKIVAEQQVLERLAGLFEDEPANSE